MFKLNRKKKEELLANYFKVKKGTFYFNSINKYFLKSDKTGVFQVISDKTYQDLDLDEIFMFVDRTSSNIGQQFLYHVLRTIPNNKARCERFENLINVFREKKELKESVLIQLSRLNSQDSYYISSLFLDDYIPKPKWFWVVQLLSIVAISLVILSFFIHQFLLVLIFVLAVNYFFHYWNKGNFLQYSGVMLQLLILKEVAKTISKPGILAERNEDIDKSIKSIESLGNKMSLFKLEAKLQSDFGQAVEGLVEIIKALFLIEPIVFFNILKELDAKRSEIHQLYKFVGEIDLAISIDSLRRELPYYAFPTFTDHYNQFSAKEIYHPLIENFVSNAIQIQQKSILLTGSNMSGKTTFIRTIGINAILSQTLNICCAREFVLPRLKVHSAIRITDDLINDKSYYFEEVLRIKEMLEESRSGSPTLFLLDEIFKGTNTIERIAAGKSVLSYLSKEDNIVFVSTHDLELTEFLKESYDLYHFTEVVENDTILFDYKLKPGQLETTNAIKILELNNYPLEIITEAKRLSEQINKVKITT